MNGFILILTDFKSMCNGKIYLVSLFIITNFRIMKYLKSLSKLKVLSSMIPRCNSFVFVSLFHWEKRKYITSIINKDKNTFISDMEAYNTINILTLLPELRPLDTECWCMWRAASRRANSYLSSGANLSWTTSLQHWTYRYSNATESVRRSSYASFGTKVTRNKQRRLCAPGRDAIWNRKWDLNSFLCHCAHKCFRYDKSSVRRTGLDGLNGLWV